MRVAAPEPADDLHGAVRLTAQGWTPLGGGAALTSRAFPDLSADDRVVDLGELGLTELDPPVIGAMATIADVARHDRIRKGWPAVAEAAEATATPGVRSLATIGGTVAARLPGCDLAAALDVHQTDVVVQDLLGRRRLAFSDYWTDRPARPHVVLGVVLGAPAPGCYRRVAARRGPAPAIATVAAVRRVGGDVELRAGAVADRPVPVDPATLAVAADVVLRDDERASAAQRARLVHALSAEALGVVT